MACNHEYGTYVVKQGSKTAASVEAQKSQIGYEYSYGFSKVFGPADSVLNWGTKRDTVLDRIRELVRLGEAVIGEADSGRTPSDLTLQAFDKALKNLRETGE
jgi:hypothetical protein